MKRFLLIAMGCVLLHGSQASAQNLIQNGGFTVGTYDDPMTDQSGPPWHVAYGTPQIQRGIGCDTGHLQMWGNVDDGESVYQMLTTAIKKGHTYTVTACIAFWDDNTQNYTPYVRVRFSAANNYPSYPPWPNDGIVGEEIGFVQTSNQSYTTYTLPLWTAKNDYTYFGVSVEDDNSGDNSATWGHIDQVTVTECASGSGQLTLPTANISLKIPSCSRIDSSISLSFRGCTNDTAFLTGVSLRGSQSFELGATGQLPRMISDESIPFSYVASEYDSDTGYISVAYTLNGVTHDTTIMVAIHQGGSTLRVKAYVDKSQNVAPGAKVVIPFAISIPSSFSTAGVTVHTVTYALIYDSTVVDIPPAQLSTAITPPAGWSVINAWNANDELTVQLTNTGSMPLQDSMNLGSITFTASQTAGTLSTLIVPAVLELQLDTGYVGFCFINEGNYLAGVEVDGAGVAGGSTIAPAFNVYPNPSRNASEVRVHFTLAATTSCEILLTDILGRTRHRSSNQILSAGEHALPLPVAGLPSGDYYVRLNQGGLIRTSKISILE